MDFADRIKAEYEKEQRIGENNHLIAIIDIESIAHNGEFTEAKIIGEAVVKRPAIPAVGCIITTETSEIYEVLYTQSGDTFPYGAYAFSKRITKEEAEEIAEEYKNSIAGQLGEIHRKNQETYSQIFPKADK